MTWKNLRTLLVVSALLLPLTACERADEPSGPVGAGDHSAHGGSPRAAGDDVDEKTDVKPRQGEVGLESREYPSEVLTPLRQALEAYEEIRDALANDAMDGVTARAERLTGALELARAMTDDARLDGFLVEATGAGRALTEASEISRARLAFGELSRFLIPVVGADARLASGRTVYSCPMTTDAFNRWIGDEGSVENPFQGREMLSCGDVSGWTVPGAASLEEVETHAEVVHGEGEVAHYTCAMHPSVKSSVPGICPICSMELTPVTHEEIESGVIFVDSARRQTIGVKTALVEVRPMTLSVRAVGKVVVDETRRAQVSVKYEGWIGELHVDEPGQRVKKGQTLFTLYSPDLYAAQEEYLAAVESQRRARDTGAPDRADYLVEAARKRLELWDLEPWQIDRLAESGQSMKHLPIVSPVSGHVVEKNVVQGAAVRPGQTLFEIAGLDRIWVEAELYESELPLVEEGQPVTVTLPYLPGRELSGTVAFVYPYLDGSTRTGRVRIELANPGLELKPDMYASVELTRDLGEALVIPESAVIYAGPRRVVFLDLGEGRLRPQQVVVGPKSGDVYPVLEGLQAGDRVVTSGNFLVAAESRLKSALEQW